MFAASAHAQTACTLGQLHVENVSCAPPTGAPDGDTWLFLSCDDARSPEPEVWRVVVVAGGPAAIVAYDADARYARVIGGIGRYKAYADTKQGSIERTFGHPSVCKE